MAEIDSASVEMAWTLAGSDSMGGVPIAHLLNLVIGIGYRVNVGTLFVLFFEQESVKIGVY